MKKGRTIGRIVTVVGVCLFLLVAAALSLALYGEALSKTKSAILMGGAVTAALVMSVGYHLQWIETKERRRFNKGEYKPQDSMESEVQ